MHSPSPGRRVRLGLAMAAVTVVVAAACRDRDVVSPLGKRAMRALTPTEAAAIIIEYVCGNTFVVFNPNADTATVHWDVGADNGNVLLPEATGGPLAETRFTTTATGTVVLSYGTQVIQSVDNDGNGCVPALPAYSLPNVSNMSIPADSFPADSIVRGMVMVEFWEGTPQLLRQRAIDAVDGTVVGGHPIIGGDGFYYVAVPDSGTARSVMKALDILDTLPQVEVAAELGYTGVLSYLRPRDGDTDFQTWKLKPTDADGKNWGLERIAAPLAWSCTIGSSDVKISILDEGMDTVSTAGAGQIRDLTRNLTYLNRGAFRQSQPHGRQVASIAAAYGNDSIGMTGVMWRAALRMVDLTSFPDTAGVPVIGISDSNRGPLYRDYLQHHIVHEGMAGAAVMNISQNTSWRDEIALGQPPSLSNKRHVDAVERDRKMVSGALRRLAARGKAPLLVMSAGNWNLDAYWGGFNNARLDFPNQVITVGAMKLNGARWTEPFGSATVGSNHGSAVDVYAPGHEVGADNATGSGGENVGLFGRTSAAAPFVAGIAGLLKSFDSTLTSAQIKQYIVEGAARDSVVTNTGGKHVANAYEALRRAASRTGAPLCGNRVWAEAGQIKVQRDTAVSSVETLASGIPEHIDWVIPVHGGRTLYYRDSVHAGKLQFSEGTGWVHTANADDEFYNLDQFRLHVMNLFAGVSHDGDSVAYIEPELNGGSTDDVTLYMQDTSYSGWSSVKTWTVTHPVMPVFATFAPRGGRLLASIPDSTGSTLYSVKYNGTDSTVHRFNGRHVYAFTMNEAETEYAILSANLTRTLSTSGMAGPETWEGSDCKLQYFRYDNFTTPIRSVSTPEICWWDPYVSLWGPWHIGRGSFAAKRPKGIRRPPRQKP